MGIPLIGALGSIASAFIGSNAATQAAAAQAKATKYAANIQRQDYQQGMSALQPSIDAGNTARSYEMGGLGLPGGVDQATATAAFRNSPGYQFGLKTGENAVQTGAAAGGSLFSGGTLKDLNNYASGMADQNFQGWLGNVGGIAGQGNAQTNQAVNLGQGTADNLSNLATQGGQNQASSYMLGGGIANTGIKSLMDLYYNQNPMQPASQSSYLPQYAPGAQPTYGMGTNY